MHLRCCIRLVAALLPAAHRSPSHVPVRSPRCRLVLGGTRLGAPVPELPPGHLPALEVLELQFEQQPSRLPDSWGASPEALPRLQSLLVALQLEGPLPEAWAGGFRHLQQLSLVGSAWLEGSRRRANAASLRQLDQQQHPAQQQAASADGGSEGPRPRALRSPRRMPLPASAQAAALEAGTAAAAGEEAATASAAQPASHLPAAWAEGFPLLQQLRVAGLGVAGPIPPAWTSNGSFPQLQLL